MAEDDDRASSRRHSKRVKAAAAAKDGTTGPGNQLSSTLANGKGRNVGAAGAGGKDEKKKQHKILVDFNKLEMNSLSRYRKYFKIQVREKCPKGELIQHIKRHFAKSINLIDAEVLSTFLYANQRYNALFNTQNAENEQ